jgi:hypothetical protein
MTILTMAALALAVQTLPAPAAVRWEEVAEEADGHSFLDPASLRREGDLARLVVRTDLRTARPDLIRMLVLRIAIDCRNRTIGIQSGDSYAEDGRFVRSVEAPAGAIAFQPLGTTDAHARLYARACGTAGR